MPDLGEDEAECYTTLAEIVIAEAQVEDINIGRTLYGDHLAVTGSLSSTANG